MDKQIDNLTVKKYFHHILDKNQSFLSASLQQRRLAELGNRISNKMEIVELELTQLTKMIGDFKALERTIKNHPIQPLVTASSIGEIAQRQLFQEIDKLEKLYIMLSRKQSADPKHLAMLSKRIDSAKAKIRNPPKNPQNTQIS